MTADGPSGRAPSDAPSTTVGSPAVGRLITGLSLWWTAVPVVFVAQAFLGAAGVRGPLGDGLVLVMLWACVGGILLAPALGYAVARATGHARARKRFATMGALSLGFCLLVALFWQFAMECAPGDPACS
ncbi:hypothetical protein ACGFYY_20420 [Streptomyces sp. NPDC048331]|uniref:hypothetical protein n=1 Tax=Streptomyces sp. NPDC048331 TaxID=3365534 RepID=UPI0037198891